MEKAQLRLFKRWSAVLQIVEETWSCAVILSWSCGKSKTLPCFLQLWTAVPFTVLTHGLLLSRPGEVGNLVSNEGSNPSFGEAARMSEPDSQ